MQRNWRASLPCLSNVPVGCMAGNMTCMPGALRGLAAVLGRSPRACLVPCYVILIRAFLRYFGSPCT